MLLCYPELAVTFDQPLFIKAYGIVEAHHFSIFVRLGGFHLAMSFLGSIGYLMEGSGLREAVNHMMSGHAYSRALRGHTMVIPALMMIILELYVNSLDEKHMAHLLEISESSETFPTDSELTLTALEAWYKARKNET